MKWSPAKRLYVDTYVKRCATLLRLGHWEIKVQSEDAVDDEGDPIWAEIEVKKARLAADMRLGGRFWEGDARDKRQTIAHELIHCFTVPIYWAMERAFREDVADNHWEGKASAVDYQQEIATDELAWVVAPLLPEWTYEEEKD